MRNRTAQFAVATLLAFSPACSGADPGSASAVEEGAVTPAADPMEAVCNEGLSTVMGSMNSLKSAMDTGYASTVSDAYEMTSDDLIDFHQQLEDAGLGSTASEVRRLIGRIDQVRQEGQLAGLGWGIEVLTALETVAEECAGWSPDDAASRRDEFLGE